MSTKIKEYNSSGVAEAFIRGIGNEEFDLNKDGKNSFLEAYLSMVKEQREWWRKNNNSAPKEHALIDDKGNKKGHYFKRNTRGVGNLAATTFLGDNGSKLTIHGSSLEKLGELNRNLILEK